VKDLNGEERNALLGVLEGAQERGLVGPGPLDAHLSHSLAWAAALGPAPERFVDLGSGGGVPGLVLALCWPDTRAVLLDAHQRAVAWILEATERLGLGGRVQAVAERAETAGRDPGFREAFSLAVARGFAAPAVTAECGSAFVVPGGRLSVSEPPGSDPARWPAEELEVLALRRTETLVEGGTSFVVLEKTGPLDTRWPRRVGQPRRRPLWS
jgi:16S rRNA (guanine527-N7)-methyltransferase